MTHKIHVLLLIMTVACVALSLAAPTEPLSQSILTRRWDDYCHDDDCFLDDRLLKDLLIQELLFNGFDGFYGFNNFGFLPNGFNPFVGSLAFPGDFGGLGCLGPFGGPGGGPFAGKILSPCKDHCGSTNATHVRWI